MLVRTTVITFSRSFERKKKKKERKKKKTKHFSIGESFPKFRYSLSSRKSAKREVKSERDARAFVAGKLNNRFE